MRSTTRPATRCSRPWKNRSRVVTCGWWRRIPLCRCGRNGCLETFASIRAIQARYDDLRGLTESPGDLLDALGRGEAVALDAVREAAWYFGSALTSLINLLNPGLIILSGQLMAGTAHLVDSLEQAVRHRALPHSARPLQVVASTLGPDGMLQGAATLVLDAVYRGELLEEVSA